MRSLAMLILIAAVTGGCTFVATPGARVSVSATGTFECGSGFHGCTAWLVIRPAGWIPPAGWRPGLADRDLRPTPSTTNRARWTVSGSGSGGPERLEAGTYRVHAVITEVDDTTPYLLGTDDHPGTGVLTTTIACQTDVQVPVGATTVELTLDFSPCSIEATLVP